MKSIFRYEVLVNNKPQRHLIQGDVRKAVAGYRKVDGRTYHVVEFWAETEEPAPDGTALQRTFQVFGTGHPLPDSAVWRGTCDRTPDGLVWHLYELVGGEGDG